MKFETVHIHSKKVRPNFEMILLALPLLMFALTVFAVLTFSPIRNPQVEAAHTEYIEEQP